MAKKKTNKKPVSKRITKAAPKTRKPRTPRAQKPEVVVTTEPAIETVWRSGTVEEFLADTSPAPAPVAETYKFTVQPVEFTRMKSPTLAETLKSQWDELTNSFARFKKTDTTTAISEMAMRHPLFFGMSFCVALTGVAIAVAAAMRYFKW